MAASPNSSNTTVVSGSDCGSGGASAAGSGSVANGAAASSSPFGQQGEDRLKYLYPMVDEDDTPLPRSWNSKDKFTNLGLSQNNIRVHYKGTTIRVPPPLPHPPVTSFPIRCKRCRAGACVCVTVPPVLYSYEGNKESADHCFVSQWPTAGRATHYVSPTSLLFQRLSSVHLPYFSRSRKKSSKVEHF
jgi:hypothetical protein